MLSRLIAVILLLVGIVGIGISVAGAWSSYQLVDSLGNALDETLAWNSESLGTVSETLDAVSDTELGARLQGRVDEINDNIAQTRVNVNNASRSGRTGLVVLFIWYGLSQLVPLYLGADLFTDGKLGSKLLSKA